MRIGIVTFFKPYGGALQCYALQRVLRSLGHDVKVVNREWGCFKPASQKVGIKVLKQKINRIITTDPFKKFYAKNFNFTFPIRSELDLQHIGTKEYFDVVIVGSDQPWNPQCIKTMGYYFYLDWLAPNVRKYAYAVSYGKDNFPATDSEIGHIRHLLQAYSAISVREKSGIEISMRLFGINTIQCLDPTLLLTKEDYDDIIVDRRTTREYVCEFFLDWTPEKHNLVIEISSFENLAIIDNNPPMPANWFKRRLFRKRSISEWLRNIRDAKYVITDSFHGTVFSILFHKKFISINNKKRGTARFESLLSATNLMHHLIDENELDNPFTNVILKEEINYNMVDSIINNMRMKSLSFIKSIK